MGRDASDGVISKSFRADWPGSGAAAAPVGCNLHQCLHVHRASRVRTFVGANAIGPTLPDPAAAAVGVGARLPAPSACPSDACGGPPTPASSWGGVLTRCAPLTPAVASRGGGLSANGRDAGNVPRPACTSCCASAVPPGHCCCAPVGCRLFGAGWKPACGCSGCSAAGVCSEGAHSGACWHDAGSAVLHDDGVAKRWHAAS